MSILRTDCELDLLHFIKERAFRRGEFTLASGKKSSYFIDLKAVMVSPLVAPLIGEVLFDRIAGPRLRTNDRVLSREEQARHDRAAVLAVGGLQVGAIPLVTALVIASGRRGVPIDGFWVRPEAKDHGTRKTIEGGLRPGLTVAIVEDVCTTGGSALKAVEAARAHGCEVAKAVALVDRLQGGAAAFAAAGVPYEAVFTIRDLGVEPDPS